MEQSERREIERARERERERERERAESGCSLALIQYLPASLS